MKTNHRIVAAALGGALCLASGSVPARAEEVTGVSMAPMQAASLDVGSKHVISYFRGDNGKCRLTLMIAETVDGEVSAQWSRLQLSVEPGEGARFDTGQGASLAFACKNAAQAMLVDKIDRLALSPNAD